MKKIRYYWLLVLACFIPSCDVLDVTPPNVIGVDKVFSTESAVTAYFAKLYSTMLIEDFKFSSSDYNAEFQWDRLECFTGYGVTRGNEDRIDNQGERVDGGMGFLWWNYGAVRTVNEFLFLMDKYAPNFSAEKVANWNAEAKVIRAWYYYTMVKRYGGVPILKVPQEITVTNPEEMMIARSSEKESWDFILQDIEEAIDGGLLEKNGDGRINRDVALALKAQVALYAASIARYNTPIEGIGNYIDPNTGKQICGISSSEAVNYYQIAHDAARTLITNGHYKLARNLDAKGGNSFAKLFLNIDSHTEDIFVKYYKKPNIGHRWDYFRLPSPYGRGSMMDNPTLNLIDLYDNLDGTPAAVEASEDGWISKEFQSLTEIFEGRDHRLAGTIYYPGSNIGDIPFDVRRGVIVNGKINNGQGEITNDGKTYSIRGKFGMGSDLETQTGFLVRKYIDESNFKNVSYTNISDHAWIVMRYAESLLIAAECGAELGGEYTTLGLSALNDIRTRAGLPIVSDLTVEEVRKQWVCEFAFENNVFWCKRRWRILDQTLTDGFRCSGLEPYWDITNDTWKFKKIAASKFPKNSFLNRYYYNWINDGEIGTNPKIYQNYGY